MVRLNPRSLRVLNQDGAPDAMQSVEGVDHVGAFLKEARETTGRTVVDVAQTLRIRRVYLEAIEDGRFDELPGSAYAVGFVRSYATYLRLDVQAVVARFKEEATGIEAPQELDFPTPVPEGRFPGGVVVTLCLLIVAAGAGGWYWWQSQKNIDIARVPPPQEVLTGASDTPVASLAPAAESATANAPAARDTSSQEPVADATGSTSDNAPAVAAAVAEAPTAPEPQPEPEPAPQAVPQTEGAETVTSATAPSEAESSGIGPVEQMAAPEPAPTTGEEGFAAVPRDYTRPAVDPVAAAADQPDLPATEPVDETPAPDAPAVAARSAGDGEAQPRSTVIEPVGESGDATPAAVTPVRRTSRDSRDRHRSIRRMPTAGLTDRSTGMPASCCRPARKIPGCR